MTEPELPHIERGAAGLRIVLISLIVLFSVAATVLVMIQQRSAESTPPLPTRDERTGVELQDVVASTHGMDIQLPTGFEFILEHWEPHRAAIRFHNEQLDQRQQLFLYQDTEPFGNAAEECLAELDALEVILDTVSERSEATPLEPGLDESAVSCSITGMTDGEYFDYVFRIFSPPRGPLVALQTRTGAGRTSELHEHLETYFTCIAAEAAGVEPAEC